MGHLFYFLAPEYAMKYDFLTDQATCHMKAISGACLEGQLQAAGTSAACLSIDQSTTPTIATRKEEEGISQKNDGFAKEESLDANAAGAGTVSLTEDPFLDLPEELLSLIMRKCSPDAFLAAWQVNRRWRAIASEVRRLLVATKKKGNILLTSKTYHTGRFCTYFGAPLESRDLLSVSASDATCEYALSK
jgi:hypothetical protein